MTNRSGQCGILRPDISQSVTNATPERRLALLDWAAKSDSIVIEDDYDSEFSYRKRPPAARPVR